MDFKKYWENRVNGGHKSQSELFLKKEAREKLYHLDHVGTEGNILDFGCGSGDLLVYYAPYFTKAVGADFSPSMLANAATRIAEQKITNTTLIEADDKTIWNEIAEPFDYITAGQVVQYFTLSQLETFIINARGALKKNGKIVFFDIIDPKKNFLVELGVFQDRKIGTLDALKIFFASLRTKTFKKANEYPVSENGYGHLPYDIIRIANKHQFEVEFACSMYYDYRYHLILSANV